MTTVKQISDKARSYLGTVQGDSKHKAIIDKYNSVNPLPVGYPVKYTDDWCDTFITPKPGDIITFNWDQNYQNNDGFADHIGIVESVANGQITTIEGNTDRAVRRRTYQIGNGWIRGFARPKYKAATSTTPSKQKSVTDLAHEVIAGKHGTGDARKKALGSQYSVVQAKSTSC